jgi:hypothetical protein
MFRCSSYPHLIVIILIGFFTLLGCDSTHENTRSPGDEPRTFYGQTVKKAKDLSVDASEQNDALEEAAHELDDR